MLDDKTIRINFINKLKTEKPNSIIIQQFNVSDGIVRLDIAELNNNFYGYQIKSDKDVLDRLPKQIQYYNKSVQFLTIICTNKYLQKIKLLIPQFWGVILVEEINNEIKFSQLKQPKLNNIKLKQLLKILWRKQLDSIIKLNNINCKQIKKNNKSNLRLIISHHFQQQKLIKIFIQTIIRRGDWKKQYRQMMKLNKKQRIEYAKEQQLNKLKCQNLTLQKWLKDYQNSKNN